MSRYLLDTSVLIAEGSVVDSLGVDGEIAISAASLAELHFGVLIASTIEQRGRRAHRLGAIEAALAPLPLDAAVCREWGRLAATVVARGGKPRRRTMDLMIAATANVHDLPLVTLDRDDFAIIEDLVDLYPARGSDG